MKRFSESQKSEAVQPYLRGKESYRSILENIDIDAKVDGIISKIWDGRLKIRSTCTTYSKMFKLEILEYIETTGAANFEAAVEYRSSPYTISRWKNAFDKELGTVFRRSVHR